MLLSRRTFLQTAALATLASRSPAAEAAGCIDSHVHVWTPDTERYPLAAKYTKEKDMQPPSFTPEELLAHCRPAGVQRVVLIQMSFYEYDNRYLLDVIAAQPQVFRGLAILDAEQPNVPARMQALAGQGIRGFRLYAWPKSVQAWPSTAGMEAMWKQAAESGLVLSLLTEPASLPGILQQCQRYPQTRVVIDHFARIGMKGPADPAALDDLCRLAECPNVTLKISAFYALGAKQPPYTDLGPVIRRLRDVFGATRLMWGSDAPYQVQAPHTYAASVALIREGLDFLTAEDRQWILHGTAERLFFS